MIKNGQIGGIMDVSRTTKKLILSLVLLAQVSQPLQAGVMDWIKADPIRFGAISTSVVLAGLLAKSYLQTPRATTPVRDQAQEKLDHDLKERFSSDVVREIHKKKLKEAEMRSYALRYNLFPAVLDMRGFWATNIINYFTSEHQNLLKQYKSETEDITALRTRIEREHNNKPIALFGYILSRRLINPNQNVDEQASAIKNFLEEQLQQPERLLFKNETSPLTLLKTALLPGEIAFVGYSDGNVQILLNDEDRRSLANLSDEQRDFIASLYNNRDEYIHYLNEKENAVFSTLNYKHQQSLKRFYTIKSRNIFDYLPSAEGFVMGSIGISLAACFFSMAWIMFKEA